MTLGECVFTFVSDFSVVAHHSVEGGSLKQPIKPGQNRDGPNRTNFFSAPHCGCHLATFSSNTGPGMNLLKGYADLAETVLLTGAAC